MIVIPAIDLKDGKCVRLTQGKEDKKTVYSADPLEMALKWKSEGASRLHVIDLDGAFTGQPKNVEWAIKIKKGSNLFIQMGGGMRSMKAIEEALNTGIDRVILGTVLFEEAGLARDAFRRFPDKIMVALDAKDGVVAVRGWKNSSGCPVQEALEIVEKLGGKEVIFTDISRDGMLEGANIDSVQKVMTQTTLSIFASGGISTVMDIKKLKSIGSPGCIIGKALYEKHLKLSDAIQASGS